MTDKLRNITLWFIKSNELEDIFIKLSDQELKLKTIDFKRKIIKW